MRISQSKVKTWRRCRRAYHYKYVEELRAKRKSRALTFGSLIHTMLELEANGDDPMKALDQDLSGLFAAEREEYREVMDDARRIMAEYFEYWGESRYTRIKGKSAEHSFEIEVVPGIVWNGKIDAIGPHKGLRFMIEHKSFSRKPSDDDRWRNLQSVTYFRAIDMLGWKPVDGTCWDYVWSKAPAKPGLLQDGTMSRKSVDTLPIAVTEAIESYGLDREPYEGFIEATKSNRSKWFSRVYTTVDREVRDYVFNEFVDTAVEIAESHGKKSDMNIERHCSWCEFEPLCRAKLQGLDYEYTKERQFEPAPERPRDEDVHTVEQD